MMNQGLKGWPAQEGVRRFSVAHFLIALVLWLVCFPFVDQLEYGMLIDAMLTTLVLLSAVLAVGGRHRTLLAAGVLLMPALVATWLDHFQPDVIARELTSGVALVFVGFVIAHLLGFILRAPQVTAEVLCAAVATYLMLAILWAVAYTLVERLVPHSFEFIVMGDPHRSMVRFEALYFSLSSLTTLTYGDIIPVSNAARMMATMEATTGVFFLALLVARLVGHYAGSRPMESTGGPNCSTAGERGGS
jgi:hypothetical protein